MLTGTIVNVLAILAGSMAGLLLTWSDRRSRRLRKGRRCSGRASFLFLEFVVN